jgi:hypothetical protein
MSENSQSSMFFDGNRVQRSALRSRWLLRLFGYDGLLPAIIFALPGFLVLVFGPGHLLELTAIGLPILAFLWRSAVGLQQIQSNSSGLAFRRVQKATLIVALLFLVLVDAFVILLWGMPAAAISSMDYVIAACLYLIYLCLMAVSSFPGSGDVPSRNQAVSDSR